jgi:hypothetical protein
MLVVVQGHASAALPQERYLESIVEEVGWALGPVCTDAENLAPPEFDARIVKTVASPCTSLLRLLY